MGNAVKLQIVEDDGTEGRLHQNIVPFQVETIHFRLETNHAKTILRYSVDTFC